MNGNRFRPELEESSGVDGNGSGKDKDDVECCTGFILQRSTYCQIPGKQESQLNLTSLSPCTSRTWTSLTWVWFFGFKA